MEYIQKVFMKDNSVVISYKCKYEDLLLQNGFKLITQFERYGEVVPVKGYGMTSSKYFKIRDRFAIMQRIADGVEKDFLKLIKAKRSNAGKKAHKSRGSLILLKENSVVTAEEAQLLKCPKCKRKYVIRVRRKWVSINNKWELKRYFYARCCRESYKLSNTDNKNGFLPQDIIFIERASGLKFKIIPER